MLRYIAPSRDLTGRTRLLLRSMLVIGPMGYGKTSFIEAKLGEVVNKLLGSWDGMVYHHVYRSILIGAESCAACAKTFPVLGGGLRGGVG